MKTVRFFALYLPLMLALVGCTSTGFGGGQLLGTDTSEQPVTFSWTSTDGGISGAMTAALPSLSYQGRFFQITQQTRGDVLMPLWTRWHRGWFDWPYWSGPVTPPYLATQFITHYSGKVVATLEATDKQHMRCRFHLVEPSRGMSGGGEGQCQLSDGRVVRAVFPGK